MLINISDAYESLLRGEIVALPTETVYGLAGIITQPKALELIFKTKERPFFDPLIVHVFDLEMAKKFSEHWNPLEEFLCQHYWPGPLTLIKTKNTKVDDLITASLPKVALRVPNHPLFLQLLKKLNTPLAAPSANKFKSTSPTLAEHVEVEFHEKIPVVDGGACQVGIESTILEVFVNNNEFEIRIYRPGIISKEDLSKKLQLTPWKNCKISYQTSNIAPGQLEIHYRPKKKLTLHLVHAGDIKNLINNSPNAIAALSDEVYLAARQLYAFIRSKDQDSNSSELIMYFDQHKWNDESWYAIKERLSKAASKIINESKSL